MKKIYHLKTCSTCQRILKDVNADGQFELQNIKEVPITEVQLEAMKSMAGSYEALFSRKAMKYRSMGLHEKSLTEADYKQLILDEYTFLKRPIIINGEKIFIGNAKNVVEAAKASL